MTSLTLTKNGGRYFSAVSNANKDAIDSIIITIVNADAANTFYIDNMYPYIIEIESPYIEDDVFDVQQTHKGDIKYLTHLDYFPRKLSRTAATRVFRPS